MMPVTAIVKPFALGDARAVLERIADALCAAIP